MDIDVDNLFEPSAKVKPSDLTFKAYLQNPVEVSINAYLIQYQDKNILVDTGAGELFGSNAGKLLQTLKQYGLTPDQITDILITHIHLDHVGGLVINNSIVYPKAIIHVNEVELDSWTKTIDESKNQNIASKEQQKIAEDVQRVVLTCFKANQIKTFKNAPGNLLPNIQVLPTVGHTPGHTVFVLTSNKESMYFWGDLIHVESVQFQDPFMTNHFDQDMQLAKQVRDSFYHNMAEAQSLIAAAHQSFPGIGRIQKKQKKYRWIPVPFSVIGRTK
ncbi:MBL fold metallo-hydrolase [Myroides sp. M-43]|uniref:MBL fold metallo-hydrolase n=1 Tax=Myroides oncorhynchi TaxID=2893756 RepID=UPI001E51C957|nr:MBL fold metallo-hydrolase [Myroides oncorhynchi]